MTGVQTILCLLLAIILVVVLLRPLLKLLKRRFANRSRAAGSQQNRAGNTNRRAGAGKMETGSMVYFAKGRHNQKDNEYRFNYKRVNGSWRAYILKMPSLGIRDSSAFKTHRLYDNNMPYVCWTRPVPKLKDMQVISKAWADGMQRYIATGIGFG